MRAFMLIWVLASLVASTAGQVTAAAQGTDEVCTDWFLPLADSVGLAPETVAPALGCRLDTGGRWSTPKVRDLTDTNSPITLDPQGQSLLAEVDQYSTSDALRPALLYLRNDAVVLVPGAGSRTDRIDIADDAINDPAVWLHNVQHSYNDRAATYFQTTSAPALAQYTSWFMQRRDAALWSITRNTNPMAANAELANWGYQQPPWPWQLADQAAIAAYVGNGTTQTAASAGPARPPSTPLRSVSSLLVDASAAPAGFTMTSRTTTTFDVIANQFSNPAEATPLLQQWGWQEGEYEVFEPANGTDVNGINYYNIAAHRFSSDTGASQFLTYYANDRASFQHDVQTLPGPTIGDQSEVMIGTNGDGYEASVYVRTQSFVVRVSVSAANQYAEEQATTIAVQIVRSASSQ